MKEVILESAFLNIENYEHAMARLTAQATQKLGVPAMVGSVKQSHHPSSGYHITVTFMPAPPVQSDGTK